MYLHFMVRDHWLAFVYRLRLRPDDKDALTAAEKFKALMITIGCFIAWTTLAIVTFHFINQDLAENKSKVQVWLDNYKKSCGKELELTYAL